MLTHFILLLASTTGCSEAPALQPTPSVQVKNVTVADVVVDVVNVVVVDGHKVVVVPVEPRVVESNVVDQVQVVVQGGVGVAPVGVTVVNDPVVVAAVRKVVGVDVVAEVVVVDLVSDVKEVAAANALPNVGRKGGHPHAWSEVNRG